MKKLLTLISVSALALSPIVAQAAAPLSVADAGVRASAPMDGASEMNGGVGIGLGFLVLVAIIAVAVSDDEDEGTPASP